MQWRWSREVSRKFRSRGSWTGKTRQRQCYTARFNIPVEVCWMEFDRHWHVRDILELLIISSTQI